MNPPRYISEWGGYGTGPGEFNSPDGVTVSDSGFVYVADNLNQRIQRFTTAGGVVTRWGYLGTVSGAFYAPSDSAVDSAGGAYMTDSNNNRAQKFRTDGQYLASWGAYGAGPGRCSTLSW